MSIYKSFDKKQRLIIIIVAVISLLGIIAGIVYDSGLTRVELTTITRPKPYEEAENISFGVEVDGIKPDKELTYEGQIGVKKLEEVKIDEYFGHS